MKDVNVTLRRSIAAAAVVVAAPVLASCGFDYQTDQVYTPSEGVIDRSGNVDVLNAMIVSGEDGSGTLVAGLVNNDTEDSDTLSEVSGAEEDLTVTVENAGGPVEIPADGLVQLADEGSFAVTGDQIQPGMFVTLKLTFENAGSVTLDVPVVSDDPPYDQVPLPSGS